MQLRNEQNHSICFPLKHVNKITSTYFCSYIENCIAAIFLSNLNDYLDFLYKLKINWKILAITQLILAHSLQSYNIWIISKNTSFPKYFQMF